jgi:hypothetical protein
MAMRAAGERLISGLTAFLETEMDLSDMSFDAEEGVFRAPGSNVVVTLLEAAEKARDGGQADLPRSPTRETLPGRSYPNGCHIAEIEIDRETGQTQVVRYTVVDDFGNLMNPMLAEGQVHGGVAQGIGQAITERVVYDADGQLLTATFMDYGMPRADDTPFVAFYTEPVPSIMNPLGMKGCGEAGTVGRARRRGERGAGRALAVGYPTGRHAVHAVARLGDAERRRGEGCGGIEASGPGSPGSVQGAAFARHAPAAHPCGSSRRHHVVADAGLRDEYRPDLPLLSDLPQAAHVTLYYEPGIQWRGFRRAHEVVAGVGINRQIRRAYLFLARNYRPGDRVVLMGYSRGAYAVRSLAGLIDRMGLLRAAQIDEETLDRVYTSIARRRTASRRGR